MIDLDKHRRKERWFVAAGALCVVADAAWNLITWSRNPLEPELMSGAALCWISAAREYGFIRGVVAQMAWHEVERRRPNSDKGLIIVEGVPPPRPAPSSAMPPDYDD